MKKKKSKMKCPYCGVDDGPIERACRCPNKQKDISITEQVKELESGKEFALIGNMFDLFGFDETSIALGMKMLSILVKDSPYRICSGTSNERQNIYLSIRKEKFND